MCKFFSTSSISFFRTITFTYIRSLQTMCHLMTGWHAVVTSFFKTGIFNGKYHQKKAGIVLFLSEQLIWTLTFCHGASSACRGFYQSGYIFVIFASGSPLVFPAVRHDDCQRGGGGGGGGVLWCRGHQQQQHGPQLHAHSCYWGKFFRCQVWKKGERIVSNVLKVHKIEILFGFDFEMCNISLLVMSKY